MIFLSPKNGENVEVQDTVYISMLGGGENLFGDDPSQGQLTLLNPSGMVAHSQSTGPMQGGGDPQQNPMHFWTPQSVPAFPSLEGCAENPQRRSEYSRAFLQRTAQKFFGLETATENQQKTINALCKTMQDAGLQIRTAIHNLYENLAGVAAKKASVAQNASAMREFAQYVHVQFLGIAEECAAIEQLTAENYHRIVHLLPPATPAHTEGQARGTQGWSLQNVVGQQRNSRRTPSGQCCRSPDQWMWASRRTIVQLKSPWKPLKTKEQVGTANFGNKKQ
jgi:hypothetical protein